MSHRPVPPIGAADVPTMYHASGKQRGTEGNSGHLKTAPDHVLSGSTRKSSKGWQRAHNPKVVDTRPGREPVLTISSPAGAVLVPVVRWMRGWMPRAGPASGCRMATARRDGAWADRPVSRWLMRLRNRACDDSFHRRRHRTIHGTALAQSGTSRSRSVTLLTRTSLMRWTIVEHRRTVSRSAHCTGSRIGAAGRSSAFG
jgi:hypothetical protein